MDKGDINALSKLCNLTSLIITGQLHTFCSVFNTLSLLSSLEVHNICVNDKPLPSLCFNSLSGLMSLALSNTSTRQEELLSLTQLHHLEVNSNEFIKGECISKMTWLSSLILVDYSVGGGELLLPLTRLTALDISCNDRISDAHISHLTALVSLVVVDNTKLSSDVLLNFLHLTRLILSDGIGEENGITDDMLAANLKKLTNLRELSCAVGCDFPRLNLTLTCLTDLTHLKLHHIDAYQNNVAACLSRLVNLTDLEIGETNIEKLDISVLPVSLRKFSVRGCLWWLGSLPFLLQTLSRLTDLTLGTKAHELSYHKKHLSALLSHNSLKRIYYHSGYREKVKHNGAYNYLVSVLHPLEFIKLR
jgi:hypothetical protein